ncbi:MAG: cell division protein FtsB [Gammaproteobacteria bacterium]|nr:cell division protein FtsB [Gammaproteobacteria bacterium]NNC69051.1 cell division protein FtsB [Gammaproteobacteria bacterium]
MKVIIIIMSVLLLLMQYKLWFGDASVRDVINLKQTVKEQQAKNEQVKQRNAVLAAEVEDLKTGLEAIEERARSELGMIKKDETFIHIVEGESSKARNK